MNKVFLMGRLTRDVEMKDATNTTVGRTGIAVDRRGNRDETDFFNLVAFGKTAEIMHKYLEKGSKIAVEGSLRYSSYEGKNGERKQAVDVIVDNFEFADVKKKGAGRSVAAGEYVDDDDIPI